MSSLREIKDRVTSVKSTRKITSAMKMIASSKLRRAQSAITSFLPYSEKLNFILSNLLSSDTGFDTSLAQERELKKVAIVAISSNSSLCGAFNANVIKRFRASYARYEAEVGAANIQVYPIGKKINDAVRKQRIEPQGDYQQILENTAYPDVAGLANGLIDKYLNGEVDKIVLVYHHFKSTASQAIIEPTFLPVDLASLQAEEAAASGFQSDYILEPSREEILTALIPKVLISKLYAAVLDSLASEHAARTMAMQIATDNADELIQELTIQYNKSRQQAITNELIDIIGGAAALG